MIVLLTNNHAVATELSELLHVHGLQAREIKPQGKVALDAIYAADVVAAVVDGSVSMLPEHAWLDLLTSLGRRMPVVVIGTAEQARISGHTVTGLGSVTWLTEPSAVDILGVLQACGAIGLDTRKVNRESIPSYNPQVPLHMLQNNHALSLVVVDVSSFRKIAIEYGTEAYQRMQECFSHLLFDLWGQPGCFRNADILCRRSLNSNTYYIFLEQSRSASAVPVPCQHLEP